MCAEHKRREGRRWAGASCSPTTVHVAQWWASMEHQPGLFHVCRRGGEDGREEPTRADAAYVRISGGADGHGAYGVSVHSGNLGTVVNEAAHGGGRGWRSMSDYWRSHVGQNTWWWRWTRSLGNGARGVWWTRMGEDGTAGPCSSRGTHVRAHKQCRW